ncbi:MAG: trypsin-like peptidase domain-containing protein [Oscillospiraceae bacterium]|nr:trypsin-like peptidase domain-containing protein [Oscillospiraceae bacterium]
MKKRISLILCIILVFSLLPMTAAAARVVLSPQNLMVDGRAVECEKYNIDGSNYFKLRDIAYLLSGTANQFEVGYDPDSRTVTITSGLPYTPNGEELVVGLDKSETAKPSTQTIKINGVVNSGISAYNLAGNNFFKLRDLGEVLGFEVDYDQATNTAIILSSGGTPDLPPAPSPEPGTGKLSSKEIFDRCSPAVFYLETYDASGDVYSSGSGFFIDADGIAVTNHHVLQNAMAAKATLANGKTYDIAGVLYFDRDRDYAVIKVNGTGFAALKAGDSAAVSGGEVCYAIGSPQGLQNTISNGIISNPSRTDFGGELIQTTAPISSGSSGGALVNEYGEVIGVTTLSLEDSQNLNFAIPIHVVCQESKIRAYKNGGSCQTLPQYAEANAYLEYESRPDVYESLVYGSSGYNELGNGDTAYGTIVGNEWDTYYVYCNAPGHIEAYLITDAGTKYAKDITIAATIYSSSQSSILRELHHALDRIHSGEDSSGEYVLGDYVTYDDGGEGQYLCCVVPKANVYEISVLSYELYETENLSMDYAMYFVFVPGETNVQNTTGSYGEEQAAPTQQQQAFDAMKDWILANYNDTAGNSGDKGYYKDNSFSDGSTSQLAAIYHAGTSSIDESLILYYVYYWPSGAKDYSYIWISPDTQECRFSYYYYESSNTTGSESFKGTATVSASDFSGRENIVFTEVSGSSVNTLDRSRMEYFAMISFCDSLSFANRILSEGVQPYGTYSLSDFGFDPGDLTVPN